MEELLQAQLDAQRAGEPYAVVTIAEASGSVPRKNGKMLVFSDGRTLGTVGGGPAERMAKRDALAAMDAGENRFLHYDFPSPDGSSCSGRLSVLIEVLPAKAAACRLRRRARGDKSCCALRSRRAFAHYCSMTAQKTRFRRLFLLPIALSA